MTRYIDADGLFEKYERWLEETPYTNQTDVQLGQRIVLCDIYHDLKYAPTIDTICGISIDDAVLILTKYLNGELVEVVRCENCKYRGIKDFVYGYCKKKVIGIVNPSDFCSYGERKSNVSEEEKEYLDKAFPEHKGGEWFDITDLMTKGETE